MKKNLSSLLLLALACICFSACFVQRSVSVNKAANNPTTLSATSSNTTDAAYTAFMIHIRSAMFISPHKAM